MPSLIRLVIVLLFLGGLVFAGMFALVTFVEPTPKEVSQRIPTRDLLGETGPEGGGGAGAALPQPNVTSEPSTAQ
ncbi:hypothetical protein [Devosia sediminis]|uniref:hypothetical protein n=1 Tax=Devosia sediminis TaxID=2798801 RepID=UPI0038B2E85F